MRLSFDLHCRIARLVFTASLALAWCGAISPARGQDPGRPAGGRAGAAPGDGREKQVAAILRRLHDIGRRELAASGADASDAKAKAADLGYDPDRIFAFVRDEVRFEPYAGVLRGARGALLGRAGNATDKSLLLKEMLEAGGHECRLAAGDLPAEKAGALVGQFLKAPFPSGPLSEMAKANGAAAGETPEFLRAVAAETGLGADALVQSVTSAQQRNVKRTAELWAAVDREAPPLAERLGASGVKLGRSFEDWQADLVRRTVRHVWVELAGAGGEWVALDPSFPGSARGAAHAAGSELKLTDADEHRVVIRLVYRRGGKGGADAEEVDLINVPLPAGRAAFDSASLAINPADALPPASKLTQMSAEQVVKALAAVQKFQPVLYVGGESYYGKPFDLKGNLFEVSADGRVEGASKVGGAAGGLFGGGGLGGGGEKPAEEGAGSFAGLAVTIDIQSPGAEPARQERVLLTADDAAGEHRRSPLLVWDILVQPQPVGAKWTSQRAVRHLLDTLAPLVSASEDGSVQGVELDAIAAAKTRPFSPLLSGLSLMREAAVARQLAETPGVAALWDTPLVAVAERSYCMKPRTGHACGMARVDIVDNRISFVPREAGDAAGAAAARATLRQGVFDTAAEAAALRESMADPGAMEGASVVSPLDDFARARAAGDGLTVFRVEKGLMPPAELALAEPDRAWVARFERPGHVVVAPSRAAEAGAAQGWWSVDPATGSVLGRHAGGRGQAMTEKAIITNLIGFAVCMISPTVDAVRKPEGTKAGLKIGLAITGCIVGMGFGFAGGAYPLIAENLGLFWAIFSGAFAAGDKILG